ncbi:hypothetical protein CXB51_031999 [Gossypium anomalum]|uniref:Mechanosensitive ion channel MscS domain-containing protein n=1 Tax=Gossypium anomalum TaxID=47600 RepID=A0A8J6CJX1_9ROSI|nr:hypothetical protein CXB51_031999 [Gossypium anomalum]
MNICSKVAVCYHKSNPMSALSSTSSNLPFRSVFPFVSISPVLIHQSQSLSFSSKADKLSAASGGAEVDVSKSDGIGSGWGDKVKDAWHSAAEIGYTGQKAKEVSNELKPHVNQLLYTHPYLKDVVLPVGFTLTLTILAWVVLPRLLRRFHEYAIQTSILPSGRMLGDQVPYDKSLWGALEDPVRYVITFMAISHICMMVAPSTVPSQYIVQAWRGAAILSFVWFLHRWKTNVLGCALATKTLAGLDREKLLTIDRFSSVGLFIIGIMALAEASGVAVQSILTYASLVYHLQSNHITNSISLIGVATAFAARDIFGNVLSGLYMQFSKPFSLGDTIKAGPIEGQVVEMGLTSTTVLNSERFPVLLPNSLFSSQVIVNKSRARWRAVVTKIPLQIEDLDKVPEISNEIKSMLKSNSKVFFGKEVPYCFLSHVEGSYAELTVGCNLRHMVTSHPRKIFFCSLSGLSRSMVLHWAAHSNVLSVSDAKRMRSFAPKLQFMRHHCKSQSFSYIIPAKRPVFTSLYLYTQTLVYQKPCIQ